MKQLQQNFGKLGSDFLENEDGATAIEYALIAAATGLALAATLPAIETNLSVMYNAILGYFSSV